MEFTTEIDEYIVLKLPLDSYNGTSRKLESGFKIVDYKYRDKLRKQEKKILAKYFNNWKAPYNGSLSGWRTESPIYVIFNDILVAGAYLCDQNEFQEGNGDWGQLNYVFVDSRFKGKGIYSVLFGEIIKNAQSWGLEGLILNSDRYLLPEVYIRWGAKPWKQINKDSAPTRIKQRIMDLIKSFSK